MDTKILKPTQESIQLACDILKSGDVVAIPTETVYGLFADATKADACANIFKAKDRPQDNPLIVHISDYEMWHDTVAEIPDDAMKLAEAFWPGPLTIILKKKDQSVNVLKPAFKEFLKENKIIEQRRIQKYWAKHGYIKVEAKHGYDVKVSVLSARATKLIIQPEELEFYLEGMYEFDGHNITKLLEMIFGRTIGTQIDIPCIGNEYEEFDEGLSIEEIFETEENTDEN